MVFLIFKKNNMFAMIFSQIFLIFSPILIVIKKRCSGMVKPWESTAQIYVADGGWKQEGQGASPGHEPLHAPSLGDDAQPSQRRARTPCRVDRHDHRAVQEIPLRASFLVTFFGNRSFEKGN